MPKSEMKHLRELANTNAVGFRVLNQLASTTGDDYERALRQGVDDLSALVLKLLAGGATADMKE